MICEQQKLFNSLDKDQRYKHTMEWEDITYRGFCNALDHPELYTWPMPDFVFQVEHVYIMVLFVLLLLVIVMSLVK